MAYEYEHENIIKVRHFNIMTGSSDISKPTEELQNVYRKAQAFDNYMVDAYKYEECYQNDSEYLKETKETYNFYMQDKENFIKNWNEETNNCNPIEGVKEHERIITLLEANNE